MINETVINEFINRLLTKGAAISRKPLSKVTVHNIIVILKMIFGFMEKQYAIVNPVKNIHLSKINTRKKFLSDKHWQIIRAALQKDESVTATAISIAVYMGLRIGEICALQKHDIDFDNNISVIIRISKDGKISADFLPSSQVAEAYLKENLPLLRQKFDDNNINYDELNQRRQKQDERNNRKKGRDDE